MVLVNDEISNYGWPVFFTLQWKIHLEHLFIFKNNKYVWLMAYEFTSVQTDTNCCSLNFLLNYRPKHLNWHEKTFSL